MKRVFLATAVSTQALLGVAHAQEAESLRTWKKEGDLDVLLKADKDVTARLKPEEIDALFDLEYHFKHADTIFERVFGKG